MKDKIILALDLDNQEKALALAVGLSDQIGAFKVGMQLFNNYGPEIVRKINDLGSKVFLDLKLHDIPNTVGAASRVLTRLGSFMFNVHAAGGREMMKQAAGESRDEAGRLGIDAPIILAVTVLTSISQQQLEKEMLVKGLGVQELVVRWALMAQEAGLGGVVCSPQEIRAIRQACGPDFKIVTPGIRPVWAAANDQKRITTPAQALKMGCDYMVIGRPITGAGNPREATQKIIKELEAEGIE